MTNKQRLNRLESGIDPNVCPLGGAYKLSDSALADSLTNAARQQLSQLIAEGLSAETALQLLREEWPEAAAALDAPRS